MYMCIYIHTHTHTHTHTYTYAHTHITNIHCKSLFYQILSKLESILILLFASVNLPYPMLFPLSKKDKHYLNSCYDKYLENEKGANVSYFQNILQLHKS